MVGGATPLTDGGPTRPERVGENRGPWFQPSPGPTRTVPRLETQVVETQSVLGTRVSWKTFDSGGARPVRGPATGGRRVGTEVYDENGRPVVTPTTSVLKSCTCPDVSLGRTRNVVYTGTGPGVRSRRVDISPTTFLCQVPFVGRPESLWFLH